MNGFEPRLLSLVRQTLLTIMFGRISLAFILVSLAAFFCAQSVDAAKGPKVTHKVYFDIKHGDEELGRGESRVGTRRGL